MIFEDNEAGLKGGAIQVENSFPKYEGNFLNLNRNNKNRACALFGCTYGQFIGSYPQKLIV